MKRLISFIIIFIILFNPIFSLSDSLASIPAVPYKTLFEDPIMCMTAKSLRQWFISYGSNQQNRLDQYDNIWNHEEIILCDPYIFKTEMNQYNTIFTVYCFSCINSYSVSTNDNMLSLEKENNEAVGLFRISFRVINDYYSLNDVFFLQNSNEELFPGSGLGSDGLPGLSDYLAEMIPSYCWNTDRIAQQYSDISNIDIIE